jgi:DNA-binding response OmpR family regulator/Flp pilus assembly protein TadD
MDLNRKRVLVVDDHPGMLSSLRRALEACGVTGAHAVRSAREAVERLRNMRYDIVLADFDLGPGPDGQQLLEHCREEQLLVPAAVFVMVTAERAYDRVMSAAEFAPDDYLVKPFTEDTLRLRLVRALERRHALASIFALRDKKAYAELVEACERTAVAEPRFAFELARLRGDALIELERFADARALYEQILAHRPIPWARLGLARAREGLGEVDAAREALTELLADAPEYLAAYDALSKLHGRNANDDDAKAVLKMALEVSPNSVRRHKAIGEIALRANDLEAAESAFSTVVRKSRNGFVRAPEDHLTLSRVLMERRKFAQALDTLSEVKKVFPGSHAVGASAAAVESLIHSSAENPREARKALDEALDKAKQAGMRLPDQSAIELAKACYLHNRETEGAELARQVIANNHDDTVLIDQVKNMFGTVGRVEQGESLIERCVGDAVRINNEGVALAKNGDLEGSIRLLEEAAVTMPDNAHIVMNAAHALIVHMQMNGIQTDRQRKVAEYVERIRERNPNHPKYLQVVELYAKLMTTPVKTAVQANG